MQIASNIPTIRIEMTSIISRIKDGWYVSVSICFSTLLNLTNAVIPINA
jgi:hypothetical protein